MILLVFALLGLLLGLITGGSVTGLAHYPLRGFWLPVAALLVKAGASYLLIPQTGAIAVCLIQYALVFAFLLIHHRLFLWPLFVFTGSMMNLLVIALNGGCMPVLATLFGDSPERLLLLSQNRIYAYCLMDKTTRLPFLGDVIRVGPAGVPIGFASAGDLVLGIGVAMLVFLMTKAKSTHGVTGRSK
jgi:hypothetical protein